MNQTAGLLGGPSCGEAGGREAGRPGRCRAIGFSVRLHACPPTPWPQAFSLLCPPLPLARLLAQQKRCAAEDERPTQTFLSSFLELRP